MSSRTRQDDLLRELDPLREQAVAPQKGDSALLAALAFAHPRPQPVARRVRRTARRLGAVVLAGACVAGGGVAVAGGGVLDDIGSAWSSITGGAVTDAPQPRLVARGTGSDAGPAPVALQLYVSVADTRCASVRAPAASLDTCADGRTPLALTPLPGLRGGAGYRAYRTSHADVAYGRVDPGQVSTVRLSAADRATVSTAVDPATGYWVTSITDTSASSPVTLSVLDRAGTVLASQVVTYSD